MDSARVAWAKPAVCLAFLLASIACADGPKDNQTQAVRPVPPPGVEIPADVRSRLQAGLDDLSAAIGKLQKDKGLTLGELLVDVRIFHKAVHDALKHNEFFDQREFAVADELLAEGKRRAEQLAAGQSPWTTATGLVVRGYVSRIDGSVQPYGLVVPKTYAPVGPEGYRLDIWFHGRGETLSELNFIQQRRTQRGQFAPPHTLVLHPYGRYCNAFKFAGEIDVLEALEAVRRHYHINEDRISVRGFSMGGAACWQFAVHYADRWFAANPGAGFSETPDFLRVFQKEIIQPTAFQQKLLHYYDCTDWAANLKQCPTIAYSGENDIQKQAADIMQQALEKQEIDLRHIVGPKTGHSIHPESAREIESAMSSLSLFGRERFPLDIKFVTYTLKYNRMHWLTVDGLQEHWKQAKVDAEFAGDIIHVDTENVTDLTFDIPAGSWPLDLRGPIEVTIDNDVIEAGRPKSDRSWKLQMHKINDEWTSGTRKANGLRKRHGLQGPIDDAFMDSFIFVRPTGKFTHAAVEKWSCSEMARAIEHWRKQFRGDARIKDDAQVTAQDIAGSNVVLWGDPASNQVLGRIADKLPVRWQADKISVGKQDFASDQHALIMIYPNPLNPNRYVVLNSGFTFRDFAYLNNARQVPMLPDWAVIDLRTPPDAVWPGKVAAADFFDESWKLSAN